MPAKLKPVLFVVVVFAVAIAGVFVGNTLRTHVHTGGKSMVTMPVPTSLLEEGDPFPEVDLVAEDGRAVNSLDIVPAGGVVLFLDLECPPCTDMAMRWQRALVEGLIDNDAVCVITYQPHDAINAYKAEHDLRFPVYQDSATTFRRDYRVDRFPLQVVIGRSGTIRSTSYDSASPIDPITLHRALEE
jgi:peroxiredoxin